MQFFIDRREPEPRVTVSLQRCKMLARLLASTRAHLKSHTEQSTVSIDPIGPQAPTRLIYPTLAKRLTPADLNRLFSPNYEERRWVPTIARTQLSQVALLVQLKIFQAVGRFLPVEQIPEAAIKHVAQALGVDEEIRLQYTDSTLYRHHNSVLERLPVTAWGAAARELAHSTMNNIAQARTDPADLVNAAVDTLVRHRFELPSLDTLTRLAGQVHSLVNTAQWEGISALLKADELAALEALLVVDPETQESPFAVLCRAPGRATRRNLDALIERHRWLQKLPNPTSALAPIPDAKVLQWANEARRLKAPELREYIGPRRAALLLAVLRQARGQEGKTRNGNLCTLSRHRQLIGAGPQRPKLVRIQ